MFLTNKTNTLILPKRPSLPASVGADGWRRHQTGPIRQAKSFRQEVLVIVTGIWMVLLWQVLQKPDNVGQSHVEIPYVVKC